MPLRFLIVSFLIFLGGILSILAAIAVWGEREIQDEDNFVATVDEVFDDEVVQDALATRLTEFIMTKTDLQERVTAGLQDLEENEGAPAATSLLAGPLTSLVSDTVYRICVDILQSDAFNEILNTALRGVHRAVTAIINDESDVIEETNGQVILNLRPIVDEVVQQLAGERGEEALSKLNIPDDAGMIVITEANDPPLLWDLAQYADDFYPVLPIITAIVFLLAILIAKSKRRAVIASGAAPSIVAGLALLALAGPVKELATTWPSTPQGQDAAEQIYDIVLNSFQRQELFVFMLGLGMVVVGSVAGDRRVVQAARSAARREDADAGGLVRERAGFLRLGGLAIAGVILIVWPEPTERTVITVGALLALYLGVIWLLASESEWATRARERLADGLGGSQDVPVQRRTGLAGWVAVHAGLLRLLGIVVGACLVLFVWDLSLNGFVLIAAAVLLYLAAIEWASASARQPVEPAQ